MGPETQGCPWDIFICPIPTAIYAYPIPWDVSHGIPIGMTFPRASLGFFMGHIYLSHSHPIAIYAYPIPWDDPIGMTFPWTSLLKPYVNLFYTVEFVYNGFLCNANSPIALHFVWSRWHLLSAFQFA